MNQRLKKILRGLKGYHDQQTQEFDPDRNKDRSTLLAQYASFYKLRYTQANHNDILAHLDQHHPGWRGYELTPNWGVFQSNLKAAPDNSSSEDLERKTQLLEWASQGLTVNEMAANLQITHQAVYYWVRSHGLREEFKAAQRKGKALRKQKSVA
ncbi:MAG: hypothetical protein AAGA46_03475 [Cyanobacteria bacterium P01_F01_bin.13]